MKEKKEKVKLTKEEKREQRGSFREKLSLRFRKRLIASRASTIILVVVLILAFIAINLLFENNQYLSGIQYDFTSGKIYTLTQTSKDQIANIEKDVVIYVYGFEDSSSEVNLLKQYAEVNSHISYEIITAETNLEMIEDNSLDDYDTAMIVTCGDNEKVIYPDYYFYEFDYSTYSYSSAPIYEEQYVTNAILNVTADEQIGIYFVTGHGETSMSSLSVITTDLEDKYYTCQELDLFTAEEIPLDAQVLVFLNPETDISETEAELVKDYVKNGGNLFVTWYKEDPDTDFTNFQSVLDLYGASVEYGLLYENSTNYYYGTGYNYIIRPDVSSSSDITSDLSSTGYKPLFLYYTQNVTSSTVEEDNVEVSTEQLVYTSSDCYNITDESNIVQGIITDDAETDSWTVGQKYTREMTDSETEETTTSNLVLFGNAEFLTDSVLSTLYNGISPASEVANETLVVNSIADITEQADLLSIQKYTADTTDFTVTVTTILDLIVKIIIFGLPIVIIIIGIVIWIKRKRKR